MQTFKYSFECAGAFPTLSLKLPQLQTAATSHKPELSAEFGADCELSGIDKCDLDDITQIVSPMQKAFKKEVLFDIDSFEGKGQLSPIHGGAFDFSESTEESKAGEMRVDVDRVMLKRVNKLTR